jgi:hypothetical protein
MVPHNDRQQCQSINTEDRIGGFLMRFKIELLEPRLAPTAGIIDICHQDHACINIYVDKNHPLKEIDIENIDHSDINIHFAPGCQNVCVNVEHIDHTSIHIDGCGLNVRHLGVEHIDHSDICIGAPVQSYDIDHTDHSSVNF